MVTSAAKLVQTPRISARPATISQTMTKEASAGGKPVLECELLDRDVISGGDIQYVASMHLARNRDDGKLVLVQVDPEFTFSKAERGKPRVQFLLRVLGAKNSELFVLTCAPEKFDALKAQFDSILACYRTK